MKRIGNLYSQIYSMENLILADKRARKGKLNKKEVIDFDKNKCQNLLFLQEMLINKTFKTSEYHIFTLQEKKTRIVYKLPYYPDRICHHAILNVIEPIITKCFISQTYSCIKGRGIYKAFTYLKKSLKNVEETQYCMKLDVKKFYPNVNNNILKLIIRKKFKDSNLLLLLDEIIDSTQGMPIGNYTSQSLGNLYLTYFDHLLKEKYKIKYYLRYTDDIIILHSNKQFLHNLKIEISNYLKTYLDLELKSNYQIFPVNKRGIDFIGYRFYHTHILLRKYIKLNFIKMIKNNNNSKSIASYKGWLKPANCHNLTTKYIKNEPN